MIEEHGFLFPDVKPSYEPPREQFAHPPKPMFTVQEQFLQTTQRVNDALERVLRMEDGMKRTFDGYMKTLSADNVAFKDLCITTYNQFVSRVSTEVNSFESDITNAFDAFSNTVKADISNYTAAFDALRADIDKHTTDFETAQADALTDYKNEVNGMLDAFRDTTNSRIDQYNANHEEAFTNYVTEMNKRFADAEAALTTAQAEYTRTTNADIDNFKANVEGRLDAQNATITDAVHYMKTNLQTYVGQIVDEMEESGELYAVMGERMGIVTPEMYGATGDGVTDDSEAIQAMINAAQPWGTVYFNNKTYAVSAGIVVDKKLNIDGRYCTIKAIADLPYVVSFTHQSSLVPSFVRDLTVDANNKAVDGFHVGGDAHVTQLTFERCGANNAKQNGFNILPTAYCVTINRCRALYNGKDGFRVVATAGDAQANAIYFDGCTSQLNTENGFNINGVNIVLKECNSEKNNIGVYVGGVNYDSYGIVIRGGYYEQNTVNQIYFNAVKFISASVVDNFFHSTIADDSGKVVLVKCSGNNDWLRIHFARNTAYCQNRVEIDCGNIANRDSYICTQYAINTRLAKVDWTHEAGVRHYIPVAMSGGSPCQTGKPNESVNLVADTTKNVCFSVPSVMYNKVIRFVGCYASTDGTTAKLRINVSVRDENGVQVKGTEFQVTLSESKVYTGNALNNMGYYAIPQNAVVELQYILSDAGDASTVTVARPFIEFYG